MANLYEINNAIMQCFDTETGEIVDYEAFEKLQMERDQKIENVALWYKNLVSDAAAYKAEKESFAEREKAAKAKAESLKKYLDTALDGNGFKTTRVAVTYRSSEAVVVDDVFSVGNKYLKYGDPTVDKAAVKKALKAGEKIDGVHLEERNNISIK